MLRQGRGEWADPGASRTRRCAGCAFRVQRSRHASFSPVRRGTWPPSRARRKHAALRGTLRQGTAGATARTPSRRRARPLRHARLRVDLHRSRVLEGRRHCASFLRAIREPRGASSRRLRAGHRSDAQGSRHRPAPIAQHAAPSRHGRARSLRPCGLGRPAPRPHRLRRGGRCELEGRTKTAQNHLRNRVADRGPGPSPCR